MRRKRKTIVKIGRLLNLKRFICKKTQFVIDAYYIDKREILTADFLWVCSTLCCWSTADDFLWCQPFHFLSEHCCSEHCCHKIRILASFLSENFVFALICS